MPRFERSTHPGRLGPCNGPACAFALPYTSRVPRIHPSAVIVGDANLADDVEIGPNCVLFGPITLGAGTVLIANVCLHGPLVMGERNIVYPAASIGFAPQDLGFDRDKPGAGCVIGSRNVFREGVTVHRGKTDQPTRIGDDNYWMAFSHAGHDSIIGNRNIFANSTLIGGHVEIADRVITGGNTGVHQFVRIGRGVFITGNAGTSLDVPPFVTVTATNLGGSLNIIGMRRSGMPREQIDTVRWVYRILMRSGLAPRAALARLRERAGDPIVDEYIQFVESAKRPIIHGSGRATRGTRGAPSGVAADDGDIAPETEGDIAPEIDAGARAPADSPRRAGSGRRA